MNTGKTCGWRRHSALLAVLFLLVPVYGIWTWTDQLGELGSDATDYLVMARHLSPYAPETPANAQTAALSRFPPLYPLLLAWGGGAQDLHLAHAVTSACFLAALLLLYAWLIQEGVLPAAAALLLLLIASLRASWIAGLLLHSEYSYLLFSVLALVLMARQEQRREARHLLQGAALAVAAAALTRTVGAALYVPLAVVALRTRRWSALGSLALALLPYLIWHALHRAEHGYAGALSAVYGHDPFASLQAQLARQVPALAAAFGDTFGSRLLPRAATDLLAWACLGAATWRLIRLKPDAVYLAAYFAILLIWPYPEVAQRLVWVVLPVMLVQLLLVAAELPGTFGAPQQLVMPALWLAVISQALPAIASATERYRWPYDSGYAEARGLEAWYDDDPGAAMHGVNSQMTVVRALERARQRVPAGQCVVAVRPVIVTYFTGGKSVFPPLNSVPDPDFDRQLRRTGCRYIFMYSAADGHFPVPLHPLQRLSGSTRLLDIRRQPDPPPGTSGMTTVLAELD
jgi:hypothetical protein